MTTTAIHHGHRPMTLSVHGSLHYSIPAISQPFLPFVHHASAVLYTYWAISFRYLHADLKRSGYILVPLSAVCLQKRRLNHDNGVTCLPLTDLLLAKSQGRGYTNLLLMQIKTCLWHSILTQTHHTFKKGFFILLLDSCCLERTINDNSLRLLLLVLQNASFIT